MVASYRYFYGKLELIFVLTFENAFSYSFYFKANRKGIGSQKKIFKIALRLRHRHVFVTISESFKRFLEKIFSPFERSACFYVAISESFKRFLETNFLENENLFQKTGVPLFS